MGARRGPWTILSATQVYSNPWITVTDHRVLRPNGSSGQYGVVSFAHRAVGVLPVHADGTVPLVGQHRFPSDAYSWELPEGGAHDGEDALDAARRELAEETGLSAAAWAPLVSAHLSNSVTDETAACFIAWDLAEGEAAPDETEALDVRTVAFPALLDEVLSGEITDSLTIMMVLAAREKARTGAFPGPLAALILA